MATYTDFMLAHKATPGVGYTHTRIGDKTLGVFGGVFNIPDEDYAEFWRLYSQHLQSGKQEWLTEKQNTDGTLVVDLDFRYAADTEDRQHNEEHIENIVGLYAEQLAEMVSGKMPAYEIYVSHKSAVNMLDDVTKDGIHIFFGVRVPRIIQKALRAVMLELLPQTLEGLPLINSWNDVLDVGITNGGTNWQLLGSRKPGNKAYEITHAFRVEGTEITPINIAKIDRSKISVRCKDFPMVSANSSNESIMTQLSRKTPTTPCYTDEPDDEPAEATEAEAVDVDEAQAFIDANTTAKEAKGYGTWSKVMFKIANKYGKTAQGLEMAIYFSQKDKKKFNREDVKTFWDKIDLSKVQYCEFGLSEVQMRLQKEEAKNALKEAVEKAKKEKKEAKEREKEAKEREKAEAKEQLAQEVRKEQLAKLAQVKAQMENKQTAEEQSSSSYKDAFEKMKAEFEKQNFKVVQNSCFVQETFDEENNRKLIQRTKSEITLAFSHLHIKYTALDENNKRVEKEVPFIPVWMNCENIRLYERMDCFPDMAKCPPTCFNIWTPFEMERYKDIPLVDSEEVRDGVAFLRNHLSIMCDHQADTLEEFEKWIAQMIQFPETKTHMPIFQSNEGSGKGSFVQLMRKILGVSKVSLTASPEEYVWGRFNNMMETTFLVFFDEISKLMTSSGIDKIKNLVTEPTIQIQHKGKGAYDMKSFHRFAGLTNAWDGGMTISKGSRRFLMCKMSDEKKGVMEYWARFYKLLENIDVLRGFYNHYKTMEVTRTLPPPKMTEFALELSKLSIDVPTLWVKDLVADAARNKSSYIANNPSEYKIINEEYVIELSGKMACSSLLEWCKLNGFPQYQTNAIKLGVMLKTKKWAGITKGRHTEYGETRYYRVDTLLTELADEESI